MSGTVTPRMRRICLVVDIEAYSGRPYRVQEKTQDRLDRALDHACRRGGIDRARCEAQDRGDGQLLLLPAGSDEAKALPGLVLGLRDALHTINRAPGTAGRLRIRAALAQGGVQRGALGFVAHSIETACRLLDCQETRDALRNTPDTDLALVVADDLFNDAFKPGLEGLPTEDFTRITVTVPAKRFETRAWLSTPRSGAVVALASPNPPGSRRRSAGSALLRGLGDAAAGAALGATPALHPHRDDPHHHHDGTSPHHHHEDDAAHHGDHGDGGGHPDGRHDDGDHHHDPHDADPWADDPHHGTPYDDSHDSHDLHEHYGHHGHDGHDAYDPPDPQTDQGWHGPHH
ncbi:hypothetical protein ACFCX4_26110 [Kitasatospora sp. NPDC056327]|uniref:hypothetical protein n=1 Tax=Kitasatospora sp. NPDC056327 TaxID=3345785 RepID=UPI0035DE4E5D